MQRRDFITSIFAITSCAFIPKKVNNDIISGMITEYRLYDRALSQEEIQGIAVFNDRKVLLARI